MTLTLCSECGFLYDKMENHYPMKNCFQGMISEILTMDHLELTKLSIKISKEEIEDQLADIKEMKRRGK